MVEHLIDRRGAAEQRRQIDVALVLLGVVALAAVLGQHRPDGADVGGVDGIT